MENYSIKDAFKSLKELDEKNVKLAYIPSLRESVAKDTCKQYLIESESFNIQDPADMAEAKNILDDNEDPEKLEQVVDVDANVKDDLKPSYKGQCLLQCPKCKTIMYKSPDDLEKSEETYEDDNGVEQYYYNVGTACPHCGEKETGFKLVGQVADPQINTEVDQESQNPLDMSADEEQEHALDFDDLDSLANGEGDEFQDDLGEELPEEENEEPVFQESLKKKLKEDIEEEPCEECKQAGLTTVISDLIKDEWEAIDGYKSSVSTFKDQGQDPNVIKVFEDIIAEEMKHVGQLEAALKGIAPESENIAKGNEEGEQQLAGNEIDLPIEESLNEGGYKLFAKKGSDKEYMTDILSDKDIKDYLIKDAEDIINNRLEKGQADYREQVKAWKKTINNIKNAKVDDDFLKNYLDERGFGIESVNEGLNEASTFNKLMAAAEALPEENIEQKPEGEELREGPVDKDILAVNDAAKALNIHVKEAWHEAKFDFENDTEIDPPSDDVKPAKFDFENDEEVDVFDKPGAFYDKDGNRITIDESLANTYEILISNGRGASSRGSDVDGYYTFETEAETVEEACTKAYIDMKGYDSLEEFILNYYYHVDSVEQLKEDEKAEYEEQLKTFNGREAFDSGDMSGGDPWIEGIMVNGQFEVVPDEEGMRMYGFEFLDDSYRKWGLPEDGSGDEEEEIDLDDIDEESLDEQLSKYLKEQIETFESYKTTNASLDEELGKLFVEGCVKESDGSESKAEFEFNVKDFDKENNKLRFTEATENITLTTSLKEKMLVTESLE